MQGFGLKTAVAAVLLGSTAIAFAVPPDGKGPGTGGQGGGKPTTDLYAEMVIIDRDVNGVPIMTEGLGPKDKWMDVPQPIMFGNKDGCPLSIDDPDSGLVPVVEESIYSGLGIDAWYVPFVNGEIPEEYAECMTEADLGRLSVVRSPDSVTDRALLEMTTTLDQAVDLGGEIGLDPAGRLTVSYIDGEFEIDKTIDASVENVAAFQRILEAGELSHPDVNGGSPISLPVYPSGGTEAQHLLDRAAPLMGAASDKFGLVGLDELIYATQIMLIAEDMNAQARDLFGAPHEGGVFNFNGFSYQRSTTYSGDVCYLKIIDADGTELPVDVTAQVVKEPILGLVFPPLGAEGEYVGGLFAADNYTDFAGDGVWGFKQAVDDARAVIFWTHEHPVPVELIGFCGLEPGDHAAVAR